ncbi:uncharacterized protein METZ01_LOCUS513703, partial [marine metagenome]
MAERAIDTKNTPEIGEDCRPARPCERSRMSSSIAMDAFTFSPVANMESSSLSKTGSFSMPGERTSSSVLTALPSGETIHCGA